MILADLMSWLQSGPIVPTTIPKVPALIIGAVECVIIVGATLMALFAEPLPEDVSPKPSPAPSSGEEQKQARP